MHDYAWLVGQAFLLFCRKGVRLELAVGLWGIGGSRVVIKTRGASFPLGDGADVCKIVQLYRCARRADYLGRAGKISRGGAEKAGELAADWGRVTRMGGNRRQGRERREGGGS